MTVDRVVRNGRVVSGDQIIDGGVAIAGGLIVGLGADGALPDAKEVIDARGAWVLPGVIDPHVHFRDPGLTDREDFTTGTTAAAIGGVATVFDMPNTIPPTADGTTVQEKRSIVQPKALVDFGLFGLVGQSNLEKIEEMAASGVIGYKFFLHQSVEGVAPCDDGALLEAFERVAATGLRAAIHAENPEIIQRRTRHLKESGRHDTPANLEARPSVSESEMVERCIAFARASGAKIHICHLTAADSVAAIRAAKAAGVDVTAETGPQWLWFTQEDVEAKGTILMFSPPFRHRPDRDALWQGLRDGTIDAVATDHAPRLSHEKICSSVWETKSGFIGVETGVRLLMTAVAQGKMTIQEYARVSSEGPARVYGLWPRKGRLAVGADADITIVETGTPRVIDADQLHSRARVTPFDGVAVSAQVTHTLVRGTLVAQDGKIVNAPTGHDVRRPTPGKG